MNLRDVYLVTGEIQSVYKQLVYISKYTLLVSQFLPAEKKKRYPENTCAFSLCDTLTTLTRTHNVD